MDRERIQQGPGLSLDPALDDDAAANCRETSGALRSGQANIRCGEQPGGRGERLAVISAADDHPHVLLLADAEEARPTDGKRLVHVVDPGVVDGDTALLGQTPNFAT